MNPLAEKQESTLMHFVDLSESLYGMTSILAYSALHDAMVNEISRLFGGDVQHRKQEAEFRKRLGKPGAVRVRGGERM